MHGSQADPSSHVRNSIYFVKDANSVTSEVCCNVSFPDLQSSSTGTRPLGLILGGLNDAAFGEVAPVQMHTQAHDDNQHPEADG